MATIAIVDYGAGNLSSVRNALDYLNLNVIVIQNVAQFKEATHLILPGVGPFASAMRKLEERNLIEVLKEQVLAKRKPFLGICVGMQILASIGHEFGEHSGLGFIRGASNKIDAESYHLQLPHIGWNELNILSSSPLFAHMSNTPIFYFVHSYHLLPEERDVVVATCEYGTEVIAAIEKGNIYGVQFHPEKSQHDGLQLLKNFASI